MKRFAIAATSVAVAALVLAGPAIGAGLRTQDRLKDGSCVVAKLRTRTRSRLKDGSCLVVARLQTQTRDRLKDGSCLV
jgi:hypothetical protein